MTEHKHSGVESYIVPERAGQVSPDAMSHGIYPKTTQEGKPQPPVVPQPAVPTDSAGRPVDSSGRPIVTPPVSGFGASILMRDLK